MRVGIRPRPRPRPRARARVSVDPLGDEKKPPASLLFEQALVLLLLL